MQKSNLGSIHKDLLKRCYVYHDYDFSLDDGGYYYTYELSKHKVEQDAPSNR